MAGAARARSEGRRARRQGIDGRACARDARFLARRRAGGRLRQQHPPDGAGDGRRGRVRVSRLRAGLHPSAVLPRHRPVPLGRAVRRSGGHLPHRSAREGADAARHASAQLARHGEGAHQVPGPAGAHLLGRARRPPPARARVQRDGGDGRGEGADRDRARSSRLRLGREPEPRDRGHEGRLRRGVGLAADQCAAQLRERRHLGVVPSRRRRRHRLLAACRHGDRRATARRRRRAGSSACCGTIRRPA